jgi:hypothetical protein
LLLIDIKGSMTRMYYRLLIITLAAMGLLAAMAILSGYGLAGMAVPVRMYWIAGAALLAGAAVAAVLIRWFYGMLVDWTEKITEEQSHFIDALKFNNNGWCVAAAAGAGILLQLALIRWQGELFPVFAFYKNFSMLACFAGLGIGYAVAGRNAIPLLLSIPVFGCQFLYGMFLRYGMARWRVHSLWRTPISEQLNMGIESGGSWPAIFVSILFLAVFFMLTVLAFIPIGPRSRRGRHYGAKHGAWSRKRAVPGKAEIESVRREKREDCQAWALSQ